MKEMGENEWQKAKCPHCGAEIENLHFVESGTSYLVLEMDGYYYEPNDANRFKPDEKIREFRCPQCARMICKKHDMALRFIRTGKLDDSP
jgi:predicted RNA-binding Zn-ribbon protein involved in translation (DUF1610 family)